MHNFEQVKDVLDYGIQLHGQLRKLYDSLSEKSEQARVRMVLDYLSEHERAREQALRRFEDETRKTILDVWLQYAPSSDIEAILKSCELGSDMSVDDVVKLAMAFDDALIALYQEASREIDDPHAKEVFESLVRMEDKEKKRFIRDANMIREI